MALNRGKKQLKQTKGLNQTSQLKAKKQLSSSSLSLQQGSLLSSQKRLSTKSSAQKKINDELGKVYEKMAKRDVVCCSGCGSSHNLTHSHIIPRSRRRDLVTNEKNITYHCLDCHPIWEHGTLEEKKKLLDFEESMRFIQEVDPEYYQLLMLKK